MKAHEEWSCRTAPFASHWHSPRRLSGETAEVRPIVSWPFALVLFGLAAALIAAAAGYPDFFAAGLDHLGAEAP